MRLIKGNVTGLLAGWSPTVEGWISRGRSKCPLYLRARGVAGSAPEKAGLRCCLRGGRFTARMIQRGRSPVVSSLPSLRLLGLGATLSHVFADGGGTDHRARTAAIDSGSSGGTPPGPVAGGRDFYDSPGVVSVQDATAGALFHPGGVVGLKLGDEVEIQGYTQRALYVPGIERAPFD